MKNVFDSNGRFGIFNKKPGPNIAGRKVVKLNHFELSEKGIKEMIFENNNIAMEDFHFLELAFDQNKLKDLIRKEGLKTLADFELVLFKYFFTEKEVATMPQCYGMEGSDYYDRYKFESSPTLKGKIVIKDKKSIELKKEKSEIIEKPNKE
ncbi:MAG: hypothetical protein V1865_01935 [bacterium]